MATSSYQTLARYDDCSYRFRARGIGDIREKHREILFSARTGRRHTKHLINRKVLCQQEELIGIDITDYPSPFDDDFCDPSWGSPDLPSPWNLPSLYNSRSDTSSPSLSIVSSDYSSVHSDTFRLPSPCNLPSPLSIQSRSRPISRKQLLKSRKQIQEANYNPELIRANFEHYSANLAQFDGDKGRISDYIHSGVEILSNAITCTQIQVSEQALQLLITLTEENLLEIQTIYFILQQGILFSLKQRLASQCRNHMALSIRLFAAIIKNEPRSLSFITELMQSFQLFPMIDEAMSYGTRDEIFSAIVLYDQLFQALLGLLTNSQQPILCDRYTQSDTSPYTALSTMKRVLRSSVLEIFINRHIRQVQFVDSDLLHLSMQSLIEAMYLIIVQLSKPIHRDLEYAKEIKDTLTRANLTSTLDNFMDRDNQEFRDFRNLYEALFKSLQINSV